jgi:MerR family transcriptional regulator, mercuric resistance operon regulatory protein
MAGLTIGELAKKGGVGVETIRYYQRRGLLRTPRRGGGIRHYGEADLRQLHFIRSAQAAGFTLEQIGELLALDAREDRERARHLAKARIAALDAQIVELQKARDALKRLARDCGATSRGPCPILAAFDRG